MLVFEVLLRAFNHGINSRNIFRYIAFFKLHAERRLPVQLVHRLERTLQSSKRTVCGLCCCGEFIQCFRLIRKHDLFRSFLDFLHRQLYIPEAIPDLIRCRFLHHSAELLCRYIRIVKSFFQFLTVKFCAF